MGKPYPCAGAGGCCVKCYDCGASGSFDDANLTLSGFPAVMVVDSEYNQQRVRQTFTGLDAVNATYLLTPDSQCFLSMSSQDFQIPWKQERFKTTDSSGASIPSCSQTEIEATETGTATFHLDADQFGFRLFSNDAKSGVDVIPGVSLLDVNFVDLDFSASYDARLCAGDSVSTFYDAGPCTDASVFTYEAQTNPVLV